MAGVLVLSGCYDSRVIPHSCRDNTRGAKDGRDRRERLGLRSDKGITFGQLVKWVWEGRDGQGIFAGQWWIYVDCEGRPVDA